MLEDIFWIIVGWMIGSYIVNRLFIIELPQGDDEREINANDLPPNAMLEMTIEMEQVNGWWYGWFTGTSGSETFIAQGTNYEEAINNCKLRVQEQYPDLKVKYNFEMKNANTTVQT